MYVIKIINIIFYALKEFEDLYAKPLTVVFPAGKEEDFKNLFTL